MIMLRIFIKHEQAAIIYKAWMWKRGLIMEGKIGKILVVDDDENISEVLKMYLQSSGYDTRVCGDGKSAQETFLEY